MSMQDRLLPNDPTEAESVQVGEVVTAVERELAVRVGALFLDYPPPLEVGPTNNFETQRLNIYCDHCRDKPHLGTLAGWRGADGAVELYSRPNVWLNGTTPGPVDVRLATESRAPVTWHVVRFLREGQTLDEYLGDNLETIVQHYWGKYMEQHRPGRREADLVVAGWDHDRATADGFRGKYTFACRACGTSETSLNPPLMARIFGAVALRFSAEQRMKLPLRALHKAATTGRA